MIFILLIVIIMTSIALTGIIMDNKRTRKVLATKSTFSIEDIKNLLKNTLEAEQARKKAKDEKYFEQKIERGRTILEEYKKKYPENFPEGEADDERKSSVSEVMRKLKDTTSDVQCYLQMNFRSSKFIDEVLQCPEVLGLAE